MNREIIESILTGYSSISLAEMSGLRLMNRVDTKYSILLSLLPELLKRLKTDYYVQEINGLQISSYRTMYLDTIDRAMYLEHHNGRRVYEKIRVRSYVDSQTSFLEVKDKNNKGRTKKKRIELPEMKAYKQQEAELFLEMNAKYPPDMLLPRLENSFHRITLVSKTEAERVTIDMNLAFRNPSDGIESQLDDLAVIEIKQTRYMPSSAKGVLSDMHIRPIGFSKYCLGTILTVPDVKRNRFKVKMIQLNKIIKLQYGFFTND